MLYVWFGPNEGAHCVLWTPDIKATHLVVNQTTWFILLQLLNFQIAPEAQNKAYKKQKMDSNPRYGSGEICSELDILLHKPHGYVFLVLRY